MWGVPMCVWMCAGVHRLMQMCVVVWVCFDVRGCALVCAGVHECALVYAGVRGCVWKFLGVCECVWGMNFQNIYWRIESLHQRTLIRILYEFFKNNFIQIIFSFSE